MTAALKRCVCTLLLMRTDEHRASVVATSFRAQGDHQSWLTWRRNFFWDVDHVFRRRVGGGDIARFIGMWLLVAFSATIRSCDRVFHYWTLHEERRGAARKPTGPPSRGRLNRPMPSRGASNAPCAKPKKTFATRLIMAAIGMASGFTTGRLASRESVAVRVSRYSEQESSIQTFRPFSLAMTWETMANLYRLMQGETRRPRSKSVTVHRSARLSGP